MEIDFKINSKIYSKENIEQAIMDFDNVSEMSFNNGLLTIKGEGKNDIEEVFNEFMNYIIGLFNEQ